MYIHTHLNHSSTHTYHLMQTFITKTKQKELKYIITVVYWGFISSNEQYRLLSTSITAPKFLNSPQ